MASWTRADSNNFERRFKRHFARANDFAVIVLKGHLLLEESVNHWLEGLLHRPEAIEGANLRFRQKLCLIRSLIKAPHHYTLRMIDAAEKLNTIRNKLAHHLDPPQIEVLVTDFIDLVGELDQQILNDPAVPQVRRLKDAIAFVCGHFEEGSRG
jgi:hypothetical protein